MTEERLKPIEGLDPLEISEWEYLNQLNLQQPEFDPKKWLPPSYVVTSDRSGGAGE